MWVLGETWKLGEKPAQGRMGRSARNSLQSAQHDQNKASDKCFVDLDSRFKDSRQVFSSLANECECLSISYPTTIPKHLQYTAICPAISTLAETRVEAASPMQPGLLNPRKTSL